MATAALTLHHNNKARAQDIAFDSREWRYKNALFNTDPFVQNNLSGIETGYTYALGTLTRVISHTQLPFISAYYKRRRPVVE